MLKDGANANSSNGSSDSALMWAALSGYTSIAKLLLNNGANVNWKNNYSETPLIWAVSGGEIDIVKLFIQHGANIDVIPEFYDKNLNSVKVALNKNLTLSVSLH